MSLCFAVSLPLALRTSRRQVRRTSSAFRASLPSAPPSSLPPAAAPMEFVFPAPLLRGRIVGRPNRFIFHALLPSPDASPALSVEVEAHSPAVGKITGGGGALTFSPDRPVRALLSEATGPTAKARRTHYTVEALDIGAGGDTDTPVYCGINQTKSNAYLAFFLGNGGLRQILPNGCEIRREVTAPDRKSRIDIVATAGEKEIWVRAGDYWLRVELKLYSRSGDELTDVRCILSSSSPSSFAAKIENKTMLRSLPIHSGNPAFQADAGPSKGGTPAPTEKNRLLKHWSSLRDLAATPNTEAVVVLSHLVDAERFDPDRQRGNTQTTSKAHRKVMDLANDTIKAGVKFWQVNFVFGEPDDSGRTAIRLGNVWDLDFE